MGHIPKFVLSASASPDGWPEKGRHIGGQKAEVYLPIYEFSRLTLRVIKGDFYLTRGGHCQ
jgi:hypothetical protein